MGSTKKQPTPEEEPGAPEWMLTFSDCMTLLLTFFVLLITFSAPGNSNIKGLSNVITRLLPGIDWATGIYQDSLVEYLELQAAAGTETGSEKPTLENGTKGGLKTTTAPPDFDRAKMFSIPSERIFFGRGSVISAEGRVVLATIASLLHKTTNRVVICEYGPKEDKGSQEFGLNRTWVVLEYLTAKHGLDRNRFNISSLAASIVTDRNSDSDGPGQLETVDKRTLEITVLDRSSYN
jgi:chemotaxis protein MotB